MEKNFSVAQVQVLLPVFVGLFLMGQNWCREQESLRILRKMVEIWEVMAVLWRVLSWKELHS